MPSHSKTTKNKPMTSTLELVIVILFATLLMTVPLYFYWANEELFEFNKMLLTYVLTTLIGATWVARMILEKRIIFGRTKFDIPIALFVLSQILSTIFSMHPRTSWFGYYTRFHGGLLSTLTYILLYYSLVSNVTKRHLKTLFVAMFSSALLVALYAIPEHFGHSLSCQVITGQFDVSCWIQDVQSRVFATFGQPNWLAAYAITLIPVGLSLFIKSKKTKPSIVKTAPALETVFYGVTTVALFVTLLFTQSRSGVLGWSFSMILYFLGLVWWWLVIFKKETKTKLSEAKQKLTGLGFMALIFISLGLYFGTPFSPKLSQIINSSSEVTQESPLVENKPAPLVNKLEVGGTDSGEIRKIVWQGAIDIWKRYPLLGSGVETFAYSYYLDRPVEHNYVSEWDFLYNKAHNEFLNFMATTGTLGIATYLLLLAWIGLSLSWYLVKFKKDKQDSNNYFLTLGILSGIIALSISNFFGFSTVMVGILLLLYPAFWSITTQKVSIETKAPTSHKANLYQYLGLGLVGLTALWMVLSIYSMWTADLTYAKGKQLMSIGRLTEGTSLLLEATQQSPGEALYHDELSSSYAKLALAFAQEGQASQAAQLAQAAVESSDLALSLNPVHLNFYKTRARVFITLGQLEPRFLEEAKATLEQALLLSPTDAKLWYNLGLIELSTEHYEQAKTILEETVRLRPNYESARMHLASLYENENEFDKAREQYQYILEFISPENTIAKENIATLEAKIK